MYDIDFYMKSYPLQQKLSRGEKIPKDEIFKAFELIIKNRYLKLNLFSKLKSLF